MRAVLGLFLFVAAAIACPTKQSCENLPPPTCPTIPPPCVIPLPCENPPILPPVQCPSSCEIPPICGGPPTICDLPPFVPPCWNVNPLTSEYMQKLIGTWFLVYASPSSVPNIPAKRIGLFNLEWPACGTKLDIKYDSSGQPDLGSQLSVTDYTINGITGTVQTTMMQIKPVYGEDTKARVFACAIEPYYEQILIDGNSISDEKIVMPSVNYEKYREFIFVILGDIDGIVIIAIINSYEMLYSEFYEGHTIFVLSNTPNVTPEVYKNIFDNLSSNKIPYWIMNSVDQSMNQNLDLPDNVSIPTYGSNNQPCSSTEITPTSCTTVVVTIDTEFKCSYEYIPYPDSTNCGSISIFKDVPLDCYTELLSGMYFVYSAPLFIPEGSTDSDETVGIFNNLSSCSSLQVFFGRPSSVTSLDNGMPTMMMERAFNMPLNIQQDTKSIVITIQVGNYCIFKVFTEARCQKPLIPCNPYPEGCQPFENPAPDIYVTEYSFVVIGFVPGKFLILYVLDQIPNRLCPNKPMNHIVVLTRKSNIGSDDANSITQHILHSGITTDGMFCMDHNRPDCEPYSFDDLELFHMQQYYSNIVPSDNDNMSTYSTSITSTSSTSRSVSFTGQSSCDGQPPISPYPCVEQPSCENQQPCTDQPTSDGQCPNDCIVPQYIPPYWTPQPLCDNDMPIIFTGTWYIVMASFVCAPSQTPLRTGLFSMGYPGCGNQLIFPTNFDQNADINVNDVSYNLLSGKLDTTTIKMRPAYRSTTGNLVLVCAATPYYGQTLEEEHPIEDDNLTMPCLDNGGPIITFVMVVLGTDNKNFLILAVVNQYKSVYDSANEGYSVFVLSRTKCLSSDVRKTIYDILDKNKISSWSLMTVNQSGPEYTFDSPIGQPSPNSIITTQESSYSSTTTTDKSCSTNNEITLSTVVIKLDDNYKAPYTYFPCPSTCGSGPYNICKDIPIEVMGTILSGTYSIYSGIPYTYSENTDVTRPGILNMNGLCSSAQICFYRPNSDSPLTVGTPILMLDRCTNLMSNTQQQTRSVLYVSECDGFVILSVYSEGYYSKPMESNSPFKIDGCSFENPQPSLYVVEYHMVVVGCEVDSFLILCIVEQYPNMLCSSTQQPQIVVLTRTPEVDAQTMYRINQQLISAGLDACTMVCLDQSNQFENPYLFEDLSIFQVQSYSSCTITESDNSSNCGNSEPEPPCDPEDGSFVSSSSSSSSFSQTSKTSISSYSSVSS